MRWPSAACGLAAQRRFERLRAAGLPRTSFRDGASDGFPKISENDRFRPKSRLSVTRRADNTFARRGNAPSPRTRWLQNKPIRLGSWRAIRLRRWKSRGGLGGLRGAAIFVIIMRVGIIGFGRIGAEHAGWLKAAQGVDEVA